MKAKLAQDVRDVSVRRPFCNRERLADLAVVEASRDQARDLTLTVGERPRLARRVSALDDGSQGAHAGVHANAVFQLAEEPQAARQALARIAVRHTKLAANSA